MTNTKPAVKSAKKKKRYASLDKRKARAGWFFVLPFVLSFLIIYVPIIFESIRLSFFRIKPVIGGGFELIPVGFQNYQEALFVDPDFAQTLLTGLQQLNYLNADYNKIVDLMPLSENFGLVQVNVWDNPVTPESVAALQEHSIIVNFNPNYVPPEEPADDENA